MIEHRAVWNAVRDAVFLADIETGMLVDANPAAEALCGRSVAELQTLHHTQLHPPESVEPARRSFETNVQVPAVTDGIVLRKDGRRVPVEVSSSHFTSSDGRRMLVGVFRDMTERDAARNALRQSEERFRQVAENAGEFIWEVDASGLYLYASPVVERILGYTPAEVVGKMHFYDFFVPETREAMKAAAFETFARREPFRAFLNWNVRKDGTKVALETSGTPVVDANGTLFGCRGADTDITERKRTEEALRQSERIYRAIGESIDYGIWVCASDGRNTYSSQSFLRQVRMTQERCSGFGWTDMLHPDDAERVMESWEECVRTQERWEIVHRLRGADGEWHPVLTRGAPVRNEEGRITCWAGINLDISALKRTEESLRASEARAHAQAAELQAIMDAAPAAIFIAHDTECRDISRNRAGNVLLQQQPRSNLSTSAPDGEGPANFPAMRDRVEIPPSELPMQQVARSGQPVRNWEMQIVFEDGACVDLLGNVEPVLDDDGRPRGAVAVLSDITERKRAEAALRESEEKFATLFRCSPVSITVSDLSDGDRFLEVNEAFEKFTGHRREAVIGRTYPPDWLWAESLEYAQAVSQFILNGRLSNFEFRFRRTSGEIRTGLLSAEAVDVNGRLCVLSTTIDITERRRAEEALRQNEDSFRSLFENATVGIYRTTPDGRIEIANPALVRMLRYESFAALADRNLEERGFEPGYPRSAFRTTLEREGQIQGLEVAWTRHDGSTLFVRESARCVKDEAGAVRFYEGIVEDFSDRKQIEDALRQSERKFAAAFRLGPAAMSIIDTGNGNCILDVNEGFEQASGYPRVELLGRRAPELGIWPKPEEYAQAQRRFGTDGRLRNFEFHFRNKSGEMRMGLVSAEPMEIDNRRCAITCTIDITERKQAEAALRESEARLTEAQRLAKVGSWEMDVATGRIRWSDEIFRIYGLPIGDQPDFPALLSYVHPKDREKILDAQARAASTIGPVETEYRLIRPDGGARFVRSIVEAIRNERGVLTGFRGASQDITQQVSATELLRESERRLLNAERIAHVGNWRWDIKGNRVFRSEELCRILGNSLNSTPSYERFIQMVAPQDRERVAQWVRDCLAAKGENSLEFQIVRPDGDLRMVACVIEVTPDEEGLPAHLSGTCQDVTDARRAQEESFARQKLESLGTLASGIAHDFNNLLGAVLAQAELAMAERAAGSYPDEELNAIRDVAVRGSEIVRQLMIYAGKESDVLEPVDVSRVVEEILSLLKATVSKHAALVTDLGENLPPVKARAAQVRQIVMNLVVNASDAIKDRDGVIRVTTGCVTVGQDAAGAAPEGLADGDYVQLEVSDTGRGMSQETQARMFDPFFTTKTAGRGLGLAVVHGIVRSLHGAIRVSSELGKGATFQILLPCAGAAAGAPGQIADIGQVARPPWEATVLVVEDEAPLRLAVGKMLGKAGFAVLEVANGSDAIELLRAKAGEIDLLLLDMTIPGAPSPEVLAEAVQARPDLKVILTSAYSEEMVNATLSAPQVHGFVRKPFQLGDLVRKLRNALSS